MAALLNESFVPIAVDREERPDVDAIYWNYIQLVNSDAGWPINVFLTPELEPVFGGTYWPGPGTESAVSDGRHAEGGLDFLEILQKLERAWAEREAQCRSETVDTREKLRKFAAEGTQAARSRPVASGADLEVDLDQLEEAYSQLAATYDRINGGFGLAPKFITPAKLSFLLGLPQLPQVVQDVVGTSEVEHAREMALATLRKIRRGGIHDQVGGGFSRLSATQDWTLPQFEKMLADNALLLGLYLDAWVSGSDGQPARDGEFADVVYELAEYLTGPPLRLAGGAFATSEGADSFGKKGDRHMREGAYYVWTRREFDSVVGGGGDDQLVTSVAAAYWNVFEHGNVESVDDPADEFLSQNVLYVDADEAEIGKQLGISTDEVKRIVALSKKKLLAHREKERDRPQTDEKVVTCYNGMAIGALARTGATLKRGGLDAENGEKYLAAAEEAANFIETELWDRQDKTLYRTYYEGRGDTKGLAEDYAFLIEGLLELHAATGKARWLNWADELQGKIRPPRETAGTAADRPAERQIDLFYDRPLDDKEPNASLRPAPPTVGRSASGGFYSTVDAAPHIILRLKDGSMKPRHFPPLLRLVSAFAPSSFSRAIAYSFLTSGYVAAFGQRDIGVQPLPPGGPRRQRGVQPAGGRDNPRLRGGNAATPVALSHAALWRGHGEAVLVWGLAGASG